MIKFSNTYAKLPENFYEHIHPKPVKNPKLIEFNSKLSEFLNIDPKKINKKNGKLIFSGNKLLDGAKPIAMAYAGHQFGSFVPQLGDGRAVLIGEVIAKNGQRFDLQLKGSGKTSFSRQGDGRSPLGPVIREYLISESLHYLGIPSTRSLAIVSTGELVNRESPTPGGILTRIASSHIRIGTFEYFSSREDLRSLKKLADYTILRHFPEVKKNNPYQSLLNNVIKFQAKLIAKWMSIGFIHGVMNTDNTTISGETIDFGPCAFMDEYHPNKVFSFIDHEGRYSYINQGRIMFWNLSKFAEGLLPLLNKNVEKAKKMAIESLEKFPKEFEQNWLDEMRKKIGLKKRRKEDIKIINTFLEILENEKIDFTLGFRRLSNLIDKRKKESFFKRKVKNKEMFSNWCSQWDKRIKIEDDEKELIISSMNSVNPLFIPRNHLVESAINGAVLKDYFLPMRELLNIIKDQFS